MAEGNCRAEGSCRNINLASVSGDLDAYLSVVKILHACPLSSHERIAERYSTVAPANWQLVCPQQSTRKGESPLQQKRATCLVSPPETQPSLLAGLLAACSVLGFFELPSIADKNCILFSGAPGLVDSLLKSPLYRLSSPRIVFGGLLETSQVHPRYLKVTCQFFHGTGGIKWTLRLSSQTPSTGGRNSNRMEGR